MSMLVVLWLLALCQIVLVLVSPLFKSWQPFRWYYAAVFRPLFRQEEEYKWKYWLVPAFYTGIYIYCSFVFYVHVYGEIRSGLYTLEARCLPVVLALPLLSGYYTIVTSPHDTITYVGPEIPFDGIIFHDNIVCRSCRLKKAARSKHCSICGRCILVADHHCVWLNNCIGLGNYQYFYLFLLSNCSMLSYATIRLSSVAPSGLWRSNKSFLSLMILVCCFAVISISFTYMQFALVRDGMTTNEKDKWYTIHKLMRNEQLLKLNNDCKFYIRIKNSPTPSSHTSTSTRTTHYQYEYYSTNPYDPKTYSLSDTSYHVVNSYQDIPNIYDRCSFWQNLKQRCVL
ncbi:palmitoyltransferase SWF1 Ecym_4282 [Eremothecium cymbalariae DBVPG|uniref:Palmitoyltransferase n=1 Tax=Eremothecium cymbalariae (strain CBS 270.75 / DBVPG 7215 / KCTC 17166 / NRRL Y-17582) TaxID=931890 RepID=G8JTJ2_ERECY|nr:hypothetical protein Ecym_4282 [Eremothecium cymbalariae DBVPG\